jgi:hypothetical protein
MIDYTVVTALVAVYGAVLATYTAVARWREKKARINVKISLGLITKGELSDSSEPRVILSASNPGSKAITLSSWGFALLNGKHLASHKWGEDGQLPHELAPETSYRIWVEAKELA